MNSKMRLLFPVGLLLLFIGVVSYMDFQKNRPQIENWGRVYLPNTSSDGDSRLIIDIWNETDKSVLYDVFLDNERLLSKRMGKRVLYDSTYVLPIDSATHEVKVVCSYKNKKYEVQKEITVTDTLWCGVTTSDIHETSIKVQTSKFLYD